MEYAMVLILTILTIIFWSGKGSCLIAGYNTMNDRKKQKYNRKKLNRVMAYCLGSVDILIIISWIIGKEAMENLENIFFCNRSLYRNLDDCFGKYDMPQIRILYTII